MSPGNIELCRMAAGQLEEIAHFGRGFASGTQAGFFKDLWTVGTVPFMVLGPEAEELALEGRAMVPKRVRIGNDPINTPSFDVALNQALKWLEPRGFQAESKVLSKGLGGSKGGVAVGMSTADGRVGYRVEFDNKIGGHINVFDANAAKGSQAGPHFIFPASEKTVGRIVRRYGRR